jgi:S-adenosylmethionine-diacylglycerol 3-amino-3-carboxypropyl transferase
MTSHNNNGNGNGKRSTILDRPVFERLLFAQCWEDPQLDAEALDVRPDHVVFSVTSGGCNTLSLAALGPAKVFAVDLNATQNYLLELKIVGLRTLNHGEYLELLGARESSFRRDLYQSVRGELSPMARAYWDTQGRAIENGVLRSGRYERYLGACRRMLQVIEGPQTLEALFDADSLDAQRRFYDETWDTRVWRLFFRMFFSRPVLGLGGLDPQCFTYVNGVKSFGEHFRKLARHALVDLPIRENYFLAQICLGRYLDERAVPPYLKAENFETLRAAADRIEILTGEIGTILRNLPANSVHRFNYSNVFEWVPQETFENMLQETHRVAKPGGRLCYRNLLVRRKHPETMNDLFAPKHDLAGRLLWKDRSFVYSHFEIAEVIKQEQEGERGQS